MAGSRSNKRRKGANGKRVRDEAETMQGTADDERLEHQRQLVMAFNSSSQMPVPAAVVQMIGSYLETQDLPAARLACACWARHITEACQHVNIRVDPEQETMAIRMRNVVQIFPLADSCSLIVGPRVMATSMGNLMQDLGSFKRLKHLELCYLGPAEPRLSLQNITGKRGACLKSITQITQLTSLTLKSWYFPEAAAIEAFGSMLQLTKLVIDSEGIGTRPGLPAGFQSSSYYSPSPRHLGGLGSLVSLQHLSIRFAGEPQNGADLSCLRKLTSLTMLDLGGLLCSLSTLQVITALTPLQELHASMEADSNPRKACLHNLSKLQALHLTMPGRGLIEELPYLFGNLSSCLQGLSLSALSTAAAEAMMPLLASSTTQHFSAVLHGAGHQMGRLCQLSSLSSLQLTRKGTMANMHTALIGVIRSCASSLQRLTLDNFDSVDLRAATLAQLRHLSCLQELTIQGADNTPTMLQVDLSLLPTSLEFLNLKYVYLPCPVYHGRLRKLQTMALRHCHMDCYSHFQTAVEGLASLRSLDLDDMPNLHDGHLEQLSSLTKLTSLGVGAISNQHVTNLPLGSLTTLTDLQRLRWCAGDMLDTMINLLHLEPFKKLCIMCMPSSSYWRMSRWFAVNKPPAPLCDFEIIGA